MLEDKTLAALVSKDLNELPVDGLEGKALEKALAQRKRKRITRCWTSLPYWFNGRGLYQ